MTNKYGEYGQYGQYHKSISGIYDEKYVYKALIKGGNTDFAALLAGYRKHNGSFSNIGESGGYWSSTRKGFGRWNYYLSSFNRKFGQNYSNERTGYSCRCIQD